MAERIDQKEYRIEVKNTFLRYGIAVRYTPSVNHEVFEEPVCYFQNNQLKFYYMDFTTESEIGMLIQDLIMESNRNIKRQIIRESDTEFTKLLKLLK